MAREEALKTSTLSSSTPPRSKAMRKGTHSCTECRRRKIRCDLMSGSSVCFNCKSRGTECINQSGDGGPLQVRRRLPEREPGKSREFERRSTTRNKTNDLRGSDVLENSTTDRRAPFIAVLDGSGLSDSVATGDSPVGSASSRGANDSLTRCSGHGDKCSKHGCTCPAPPSLDHEKLTCESLRAEMPPYDLIMRVALEHADWWVRVHNAVRGASEVPVESFPEFVQRNYTSNRPSEVGTIAIAYAFSCEEDAPHLYALVNRLVVSDMAYVSTVEGLECLILLAILYADEGQARRSWMIWRRGVVVAQLTDLYQACLRSKTKRRLWLSLYRGDRMMSLFLGLPYGFNDLHHQELLQQESENVYEYWNSPISIGVAVISGKTVDRNLSTAKDRFSTTLQLDEQMSELAAVFPSSWWELPIQPSRETDDREEVWAQLHLQIFFFHLRIYIYLPFFSGPEDLGYSSIARRAGSGAARELLRRYLTLCSRTEGSSASECKLVDFMAFTAAIVLLLGCSHTRHPKSVDSGGDMDAVLALIRHFQTLESREKDPIASQCCRTLTVLLSSSSKDGGEVRIPFFGTVSRKNIQTSEAASQKYLNSGATSSETGVDAIHSQTPSSSAHLTPPSIVPSVSTALGLPSDAYLQTSSVMEQYSDAPELGFLYHLEETSMNVDAGWEFLMDVDTF